jgi:hypothetical protein
MRAYFLRNGRIRHVVELPNMTDEEAVKQAKALFVGWTSKYDAFEVWERTRRIHWHGRISRRKGKPSKE